MATDDALRDELAGLAVTLRDLETTLHTLAQGLARHLPGDLTPVLDELARLQHLLVTPPRRVPRWPWYFRAAVLGLGLSVSIVTWERWRGSRHPAGDSVALFREVDQILVTHYKQISPSTQAKLQTVYMKAGVPSPGQRQQP